MKSREDRRDLTALSDFMGEDILSTPGDRMVEEVVEDCGVSGFLASAFDVIACPLLPNGNDSPTGLTDASVHRASETLSPGNDRPEIRATQRRHS